MIIDADVAAIAKRFGSDPALIQAVVNAEKDILKAVRCSIPSVTTREQAIEVTCRSANHAASAYLSANDAAGFVAFWGARWAPVGASNDPKDQNRNWVHNVIALWKRAN